MLKLKRTIKLTAERFLKQRKKFGLSIIIEVEQLQDLGMDVKDESSLEHLILVAGSINSFN